MKYIYLLLLMVWVGHLAAQNRPPAILFDPVRTPIAVQEDTSMQLLVSDFLLNKSIRNALKGIDTVYQISCIRSNGRPVLSYHVGFKNATISESYIVIYLYRGLDNLWYASNEAITCGRKCQDCTGCSCTTTCGNSNARVANVKRGALSLLSYSNE